MSASPRLRTACIVLPLLLLTAGCVIQRPSGPVSVEVVAPKPPPPMRYEVAPPLPPERAELMVWDPGHWHWDGHDWDWVPGHYVKRPHREAHWVPGHWDARPNGTWIWVAGRWR